MKKACHVLYTDLVTPCPWHGLHSCEHSVSCEILHSAHTRLSCADSPHSSCYLWSVSRVLCFPSLPPVLEGLTLRAGNSSAVRHEGWGKEGKILFFSFVALVASAGQKNLRRPFCSFQWNQFISTGLETTSPHQLWDRTEYTKRPP